MKASGISVLTLVKGRRAHLARMIEGLRRSDVPPGELVVVDLDGGWMAPAAAFPIRVVSLPSAGLPLAKARNAAAAHASFDALLFLDVDCIPTRRLVAAMAESIDQTPGLICADVRYLGPREIPEEWQEEILLTRALSHPVRRFPEQGLRRETNYGLFWSLAFGIRRSLFEQLGGFDETFVGYGAEDTDFGFRAREAAVALFFLGGSGALHQHHDVFDPPIQHFSDIIRNAVLFHHKWQVWPMESWLDRFDELGLIDWRYDSIRILREPTALEIAHAKTNRRF